MYGILWIAVFALLNSPVLLLAQEAPPVTLAIEGVTIIDPTAPSESAARHPNQTVLIAGNRIMAVGPTDIITVPSNVSRIDARGQFLIPGFWDMHVHFNRDTATQLNVLAPLMIAHGITGVRDMLSDCWEPCQPGRRRLTEMRTLQRQINDGEVLAPRLLALSSPLVRGPRNRGGYPAQFPAFWQPRTAEQGRELARFLKARGNDFIKTYNSIPPAAFQGLMEEANRIGIEVAGHLPWSVHPIEAAKAGMRSIEHARWPGLACNPEYDAFRAMYVRFAQEEADWGGDVFGRFRDAVVAQFDEALCQDIFRALVQNDTYLVPSHLTREMDAFASDPAYRKDPRRKYVPPARLRSWDRDLQGTANGSPELLRFYREFYDLGLRITGMAHKAGVNIMVGTDTFDTMVFPGFSYHDELVHLSEAGLSPLAILKAATYQGAVFLQSTDDFGTVAPGKMADLVLLDADPLLNIRNTTNIDMVIFDGQARTPDDLDAMIEGVEAYVQWEDTE